MKKYIFKLLIMISFIFILADSSPFYPIQTGTFEINSKDLLGLNKITKKQIILQTPSDIFQNNQNINIVCAISSIKIDQRVGFQISYKLSVNQNKQKIIQVNIQDKKGYNYPDFHVEFDFLIAQDLRSDFYNMTDWQQHLSHQSRSQQQMNTSNRMAHNQLYLFPNGFSSINLTADVMYGYVAQPYDMYTIHYMTGKNNLFKQGWIQKQHFIYQRWVLFPRYPFGFKQCGGVFQSKLTQSFYFQCDKKGIDGYFYGLSGYSGAQFKGKFQSSNNQFSFNVQKMDPNSKYSLVAFPFKVSQRFKFIDNRHHQSLFIISPNSIVSSYQYIIVISLIVLLIVGILIYFIRRKKIIYFDLQQEKINYTLKNKKRNNKNSQDKNSDQQLKQQEMYHSVIISGERDNVQEQNITTQQ